MKTKFNLVLASIACLVTVSHAAESFYASSERFGYTGTVSVYDTFANAQSGRNARFTAFVVPQRDGSLFTVHNFPSFYGDSNIFLTNWYANNGNSPSDTDFGFIQMYDSAVGNPTTWQNQRGWWNKSLDTFTVQAKGKNASYANTFARFWNAGYADIGGSGTSGTFLNYDYQLVASGMSSAPDGQGHVVNTSNPTSYSGYFSGLFLNQSTTSPQSNGYYVINLQFNNVSWATANSFAAADAFASNQAHN
jgi:hypothetical protein